MKSINTALACALVLAHGVAVAADSPEVQQLRQQMQAMQEQMQAMQSRINAMAAPAPAGTTSAASPESGGSVAPPAADSSRLTTNIGGASVTLYGFADVSADQARDGVRVRRPKPAAWVRATRL
jgi:DNA-binding transcriptional LysR family regulator